MDRTTHTTELATQAGGHEGAFRKTVEGRLMKVTTPSEMTFYQSLATRRFPEGVLESFFPTFYGIGSIKGRDCIIMSDMTEGFNKASVMDIKMGTTCVAPDADEDAWKKERTIEKDKHTTTGTLGFRIVAARIYKKGTGFETYDKDWCRTVKKEGMEDALRGYFHDGETLRRDICAFFLDKLRKVYEWYSKQQEFRLYASSLLFVYDGESETMRADVRLIDFAHAWPIEDGGHDDGYIFGLDNLLNLLQAIVDKS